MGGSTSEPVPDPALDLSAAAPISDEEAAFYTRTGKQCCFSDSAVLGWRLRQAELMNWAIQTLSRELCKHYDVINFRYLSSQVMTFQDLDGNPSDMHAWSIISDDLIFKGPAESENKFKAFENYITREGGRDPALMKKDFENFLIIFIRLRDALLKKIASSCE